MRQSNENSILNAKTLEKSKIHRQLMDSEVKYDILKKENEKLKNEISEKDTVIMKQTETIKEKENENEKLKKENSEKQEFLEMLQKAIKENEETKQTLRETIKQKEETIEKSKESEQRLEKSEQTLKKTIKEKEETIEKSKESEQRLEKSEQTLKKTIKEKEEMIQRLDGENKRLQSQTNYKVAIGVGVGLVVGAGCLYAYQNRESLFNKGKSLLNSFSKKPVLETVGEVVNEVVESSKPIVCNQGGVHIRMTSDINVTDKIVKKLENQVTEIGKDISNKLSK